MLHSDVGVREPDFIFKMLDAMTEHNLSVLSAAVMIKSGEGITSTAIDNREDFPRRLTLTELRKGPETLSNDVCKAMFGHPLLINTGCMIWDMKVLRAMVPNFAFEFHDGWLAKADPAGKRHLVPFFRPEDWLMSRKLNEIGVPFGVTRCVTTLHEGSWTWATDGPSGTWATDQQSIQLDAEWPCSAVSGVWPSECLLEEDKNRMVRYYESELAKLRSGV